MKTKFLFAFVLLFAFSSSVTADIVVDTEGDFLKNGGSYHIVPALFGKGGGLGLAATGNETCPLTVVQIPSEVNDGLGLILSSLYRPAYIPEGLPLDIAFSAVPTCAPTPSKWTTIEEPAGKSVKITGYENAVDGKVMIMKYQKLFYKLVFCPLSGDPRGDLGIYYDEVGTRHLVVGTDENPLAVVFKKSCKPREYLRCLYMYEGIN